MLISVVLLSALALLAAFLLAGLRYIPNDRVGIVEKRFSGKGSLQSGFIALDGEAGYQPDVLRGGLHWLMPLQYVVHRVPLVTIAQGKIGYVFARDGIPLAATQTLASNDRANDFENVRAFLAKGGQKGPQRALLREGTYALNLVQFAVFTESQMHYVPLDRHDESIFTRMAALIHERGGFVPVIIKGEDDVVGVVTVHDGPSLPQGEIIAPTVGDDPRDTASFHNNFQNPERFLAAGGFRGRQLQVLVEGTYFVNRLFATIELIPKTVVEVGTVGVVVSYTGAAGQDLSGIDYKHGELVEPGMRGVWSAALLPGKYAFNTYAGKMVMVPTTNFILKWNRREVGSHRFDENLSEVSLITKDAFEPSLPLSVVVHIDYRKAPLVVQRFGDIKRLVEQTLDPMVAAYFKNVGQTRTLIQLIQDRAKIQEIASLEMQAKFAHYNLELEEVLIGTPASQPGDEHIEQILAQIRQRQIAEEQMSTYSQQEKAAVRERELREAEARAAQQKSITESELAIAIQSNQGKAEYQRSLQQAAQIRTLAEAEADKVRRMAEAEADRAARVGIAEAIATEEKVAAYGGPRFQVTQAVMNRFSEAIERAGVDVVPRIVMNHGGTAAAGNGATSTAGTGSAVEALLAILLNDKVSEDEVRNDASHPRVRAPGSEALRAKIRSELLGPTNGH